jgi:ribosomal silencing factor RsfS
MEGQSQEGWLVLDYGDVVVHLFSPISENIMTWKTYGMMGKSY